MATAKDAPKFKLPKTLAACADLAYEDRARRLVIQRSADSIEAEEKALKAHLIENLPKSEASGVSGKVANAKVETKQVPSVKDWEALFAWIKKQRGTTGFHVLGRTIAGEAIQELWEAGKKVPGVEPFTVVKLSLTKI